MRRSLKQQVYCQNKKRNNSRALQLALCLKLIDHKRNRLVCRGGKEGYGRNGYHAIDEEIRKHLYDRAFTLRDKHVSDHIKSAYTHRLCYRFKIFIDLGKRVVYHQIRRRHKVNEIHYYENYDSTVYRRGFKRQNV